MQKTGELILYKDPSGDICIDVCLEGETVWLSEQQMAMLFGETEQIINTHIENIFEEGELARSETSWTYSDFGESPEDHAGKSGMTKEIIQFPLGTMKLGKPFLRPATVRYFSVNSGEDGLLKRANVEHYSLEMVISVGYRVNSLRGAQFRMWATQRLREYLIKGFSLNDRRLEEARMTEDYFKESLERVRNIRSSKRNLYQQVLDLFASSADYDPQTRYAWKFFAILQRKFHYAITSLTASSLLAEKSVPSTGKEPLANWEGEVSSPLQVQMAKSYLRDQELKRFRLLLEQFLSYAELQLLEHRLTYMEDWLRKLDEFLRFHRKDLEDQAGRVSSHNRESYVRVQLAEYLAAHPC